METTVVLGRGSEIRRGNLKNRVKFKYSYIYIHIYACIMKKKVAFNFFYCLPTYLI